MSLYAVIGTDEGRVSEEALAKFNELRGENSDEFANDVVEGTVANAEEAFQACNMGRPHLDNNKGKVLRNISSLAFGGLDLKTCYLGCLLGDQIGHFTSPIAGLEPSHWSFS